MVEVEKFLCRWDLIQGGLIIGWYHLVLYSFAALGLMIFPWFTKREGK